MNLLLAAALLLSALSRDPGADRDSVCATWANNAAIGGSHALMGHPRRMIPLTQDDIVELVEHRSLHKLDGIPVLVEHYQSPEGRAFLESSVMYGYDFVKRTPAEQLPETAEQAYSMFLGVCHDEYRVVSR